MPRTARPKEEPQTALSLVPRPVNLVPHGEEYLAMTEIAKGLALARGFVPDHFLTNAETARFKIMAAMLMGRELGIGPMESLQKIQIINGKATLSAELMVSLIRRAGHSIVGTTSPTGAKVHGKRRDTGDEMDYEFTIEMARRAGLVRPNSPWSSYPEAMCWARAVSQLARMLFSDVLSGATYVAEEVGGEVVLNEPVNVTPDGEISEPSPESVALLAELTSGHAADATPGEAAEEATAGATEGSDGPAVGGAESPAAPSSIRPSVSPVAVRRNVVTATAPQVPPATPEAPATVEPPQAAPAPQDEAVPAISLAEEIPAAAPVDPLATMRETARWQAAKLFRLRVKLQNAKGANLQEPDLEPNEAADKALAMFIDSNFPSRKLQDLQEVQLENVIGALDGLSEKIIASGITVE